MALALVGCASGQDRPDTPAWRLLRASEAEQIAAVNAALDRGLPPDDAIVLLTHSRSSLALPLFENRIECVLKSAVPADCFTEKNIDIQRFVYLAAMGMAYAPGEEALRQLVKLVRLDEAQFGPFVGRTLDESKDYSESHNPFVVAYSGLSIGGHVLDKPIVAWAENNLTVDPEERARAEKATHGYGSLVGGSFGPPTPSPARKMKHLWGEAMLKRYGGAPTDAQWASDPIASGLSRLLADSVHSELPELIGSAQALVEISKIIQLDGHWSNSPLHAENPFTVAYIGLAIGNPTTQHLILAWAEKHLTADVETMKHVWADAVLTRYGGVPTDAQWAGDPIASGLSRPLAQSLHREMSQLVNEALQARASK
jgi:hypothetical protein